MSLTIVFVHGWSVTNLNTYGELPLRLKNEAALLGSDLQVEEIFLGKYISFHDEVRLPDISRAFETAVNQQLADVLTAKQRFICITHSTGGPVVRDWWNRYYIETKIVCPMSHLIMLAPANYGSALAQLGKSRLSRIKSWFEGVEPGQGVLDWLELGSRGAWELNKKWIQGGDQQITKTNTFPFVLTGQSIDRSLYDNLNSYTGELGSDGVVRVSTANLQGNFIKLSQPFPEKNKDGKGELYTKELEIASFTEAPASPLRIITNKSHSGSKMGIMASEKKEVTDTANSEIVKAIFDCINVKTKADYTKVYKQFVNETAKIQQEELVEIEKRFLLTDRYFIHDRFSNVIFKVMDSEGYAVTDYDLLLTVPDTRKPGLPDNPNLLPEGFLVDRQRNNVNPETITYFFNYDIMNGSEEVRTKDGETIVRGKTIGISELGLTITPRPNSGFVRYLPCSIKASKEMFDLALKPNATTMIEICLQRLVDNQVFRVEELKGNSMPTKKEGDFSGLKPGNDIIK